MSRDAEDANDRRRRRQRGRSEWTTIKQLAPEKPTIRRDVGWELDSKPTPAAVVVPFTRQTVPHVVLPAASILRLKVDAKTGFVLSLVDGRTSVEALSDIVGMEDDALFGILESLRELGAIAHKPRPIG